MTVTKSAGPDYFAWRDEATPADREKRPNALERAEERLRELLSSSK